MNQVETEVLNNEIKQEQFDLKVFVLLLCGFTKKSIKEKYNAEVKATSSYQEGYLKLYNNKIFTELLETNTPRRNKLLQPLNLRSLGIIKKERVYKQKQKQQISIEKFFKTFPTVENQGELIRFLYFSNKSKAIINNQIVEKREDTRTVTYLVRENQPSEEKPSTNTEAPTHVEIGEVAELQSQLNNKTLKQYIFTIKNVPSKILYENRLSKEVRKQFSLGVFEADIKNLKKKIKINSNKKLLKLSICTFIEKYQLEDKVFLYKSKAEVFKHTSEVLEPKKEPTQLPTQQRVPLPEELPIYREVKKLEEGNKKAEATIEELIEEIDKIKEKLVITLNQLKGE